uniref:Uncharacterized protein n=1 Tax=Utricularia reniformis TaxID=192314 RepID=A0A1Y0B2P5_9LAMI|nr:hypothetical protein AEK19_MT1451 [Utricularia reniformis]ART31643.1 hypothetical protein AEK19_MT1451 [Utricularia reniformis]
MIKRNGFPHTREARASSLTSRKQSDSASLSKINQPLLPSNSTIRNRYDPPVQNQSSLVQQSKPISAGKS